MAHGYCTTDRELPRPDGVFGQPPPIVVMLQCMSREVFLAVGDGCWAELVTSLDLVYSEAGRTVVVDDITVVGLTTTDFNVVRAL